MNLEHIAEALKYCGGTHTVGDVVDGILDGRYFLLENEKATIVWELEHYPRLTRINGFLAAGELESVRELCEKLCSLASENNMQAVIYGRKGWERVWAKQGFTHAHTVLTRMP